MDGAVGLQSYTYRKFSALAGLEQARQAGVTALEVYPGHIGPDADDTTVEGFQAAAQKAGIRICGYGVISLGAGAEAHMRLAKRLGCEYVSIDVRPDDRQSLDQGLRLAEQLGLKLGIHNHGPGHHYSTLDTVLAVLRGRPERLGACVDTGHFLRAKQDPVAAIRELGPRVHAVHLKDFVDERTEVMPGTGGLNMTAALAALRDVGFSTAHVLEYEADADNPTPAVSQAVAAVRKALATL